MLQSYKKESSKVIFAQKIGCWSFVKRVQALCNSVNHPPGTWKTKCESVTKQEYFKMILENVIPGAIEKWPYKCSRYQQTILIQQNNSNTNALCNDSSRLEAKNLDKRLKFKIKHQPYNPLDTNILDLRFLLATIIAMATSLCT